MGTRIVKRRKENRSDVITITKTKLVKCRKKKFRNFGRYWT